MAKFRNEFSGGLVRDRRDSLAPKNTYYTALNAVPESESAVGGLVNEQSNEFSVEVPGNVVGTTYIEKWKKTLIFSDQSGSSLYLFDHVSNQLEFVCSDSEFGCNWSFGTCEDLYGEVKTHGKCDDLVVYFSSNCIYYRVNISEMLDSVRKQIVIDCEECDYFTLFDNICTPIINNTPVYSSTSTLESGAVAFAIQLTDGDGNDTNWFPVSNTVYLESENNVPGEGSENAAELFLSGLDRRYEKIKIAAIKTGAGNTTIELIDTINYSGDTFTYLYYGQKGTPLNIATITTQSKAFIKGKDLIQHDGRLYFYNLKNEKNLNYQKYANSISVEGVEYEVSLNQQLKYKYPSMMRGETYDIGIVWNYNDGTHSKAFHIPACGGGKASGGEGQSSGASVSSDAEYVYSAEDEYEIFRNPENLNDESDAVEDAQQVNIENIDTNEDSLGEAAVCIDNNGNPYCCDGAGNITEQDNCDAAETAIKNDFPDVSNMFQNYFETLAEYGQDKHPDNVELNTNTSLKEAALDLYRKGVKEREYVVRKRPTLTVSGGGGSNQDFGGEVSGKKGVTPKGDSWSDVDGLHITEEVPKRLGSVTLTPELSEIEYPDIKDCEGNRMFPEGNICHHKFPTTQLNAHFVNTTNGVQNYEQAANDPYGGVFIRLMGVKASGIHIPTEDELPKPLCPNTPYKIVYVKRDNSNKTILAKGWVAGVHEGLNGDDRFNFIRHGVNSFESVFRGCAPEPNSRFGIRKNTTNAATFHSPDTDLGQSYIAASHIIEERLLKGIGFRHGLYAKGEEPQDTWYGQRKDQRGARISNNLTKTISAGGAGKKPLRGISYSRNNTVTQAGSGFTLPLVNVYNESSVYLEADSPVLGTSVDRSFQGDVLNHQSPTRCSSAYLALYRERDSQYGAVENRSYIDLGLSARGASTEIEGICGDIFITPYSKRRTSFVSEKVGDFFNVNRKPGSECRERSICDTPDDKIFEILGLNSNATELPESGDRYDPKNYAGLHTTEGGQCGHRTANASLSTIPIQSESDWYWPGTVTGVVHSIVEAEIPGWARQTGDPKQDQIYYPKLKDFYLDSNSGNEHPWEESYLNHVNYVPIYQPSKAQLAKLALIRNIVMLIIPAGALVGISNIETLFEAVATMFIGSAASAMWMLSAHTLFTKESIRRLFGIEGCLRDEEGAGLKYKSERHWDNYSKYNPDFKKLTTENQYLGINSLYNTCDCDSCDEDDINQRGGNTNKEIYYSAKQNLDSEIDAYQNVKINGYNEMPAHAGNVRKMFLQNNNLYVHSTAGIWTVQLAIGNLPADIGGQLTGDGELLMRPMLLLDGGMTEGFAGTNHPNASINIPAWGYFFVDDVSRKIYRFNGQPEEISAYGMRKFFQKHLPFCSSQECFDEKQDLSYSMGWDHQYNRLLLTKLDGENSFTISYSPLGSGQGRWLSFHSYTPDRYIWDRFGFFSIRNNEIWKHNVSGKFQSFYGSKEEYMIQFTMLTESLKTFSLKNVTLITEANKGNNKMLDVNFTRAAFWNNKYSTSLLRTNYISDRSADNSSQLRRVQENNDIINIKRNFDEFDITNIYHNFDQSCDDIVNITEEVDCSVIETIKGSTNCSTVNKQNNKNRFIEGRYVNTRLIYDDVDDIEFNTLFIEFEDNTQDIKQR